ncbi:MAG: dihydropteroate synthase [Thermoguttaceae bacterium]|nr:dihydropteroate synthase [Thermoguttaceae bacterium]
MTWQGELSAKKGEMLIMSTNQSQGAGRALAWQLRTRRLTFGRVPLIMGIVNVTPDSFYDGGKYLDVQAAVDHALRLEAEGADILDIGGESTRPYATPVPVDEELRRVIPVVKQLVDKVRVPLSIDTYKAKVAEEALAAGAEIVNDVTALRGDPRMLAVVVETGAALCLMHMQGSPQTMQVNPRYQDVVAEVLDFLSCCRDRAVEAGVAPEKIAVDPGIGFGKRLEHNVALLQNMELFHRLGCPVLVGPSRKRFIGDLTGALEADRLPGTIATVLTLARKGVQIVRVHDVAAVRQALRVFEALELAGLSSRGGS